jgi:tRNA modification GTPase
MTTLLLHKDTIAAQATAPGRSGVAIVRVSGPKVMEVAEAVLHTKLVPRQATYLTFYDENDVIIDQGVAIFFPNPHSFTGEDVLEFQGHGGPVLIDMLLQRLLQLGVRLARPGEFSERAFLNGKMDLTQAEAIADLINASSRQAARLALRSLQGEFSREIQKLTEKVIYVRMYIEAAIDFTDEEIDFLADNTLMQHLNEVIQQLDTILYKAHQGSVLREGLTVIIVGEPNVGKSSLLNSLSGKELAIVTDIPGTTRDVLRNDIIIDGMPIHIIDTAGLRDSEDKIEQEGIRRAYHEMEKADVMLYLCDATRSTNIDFSHLPEAVLSRPCIVIKNKIDLLQIEPNINQVDSYTLISLSAKTGAGISLLKKHLCSLAGLADNGEGIFLARRRHLDALTKAKDSVLQALLLLQQKMAPELAAEELRLTQLALNEITGVFTPDDLLGRIFSSFCIGK